MRIALISDLHMEFRASEPVQLTQPVDALILAGDINSSKKIVETAVAIANGLAKKILLVAGNHEFYGDRIDKAKTRINADVEAINVFYGEDLVEFLDNSSVYIDGWHFLGGTMWTDYNLEGRAVFDMMRATDYMNDHRRIKINANGVYRKFLPCDAVEFHKDTTWFLRQQLVTAWEQQMRHRTVVVTHHAPSYGSVNEKYRGPNELNSAYASHLDELLHDVGPAYWFHGHMHDPCDYMVADTRVVANPRGYPGERANPQIRYMDL